MIQPEVEVLAIQLPSDPQRVHVNAAGLAYADYPAVPFAWTPTKAGLPSKLPARQGLPQQLTSSSPSSSCDQSPVRDFNPIKIQWGWLSGMTAAKSITLTD
ncbi:hypothetical protein [Rhizobium sp. CF080]|uniref:hypothetical protein n=1 Tax=Rhizobium sp. (strain CF080) TaxID=1144310 RepID=UPI0012DCDA13|nr:hypothetical protein [Rhizobium sp. CF080]